MFTWPKTASNKKGVPQGSQVSVWLFEIGNRRDLLIYSNVLNLVPNHGTRTLSLVGYYGLVLLFGQIRVVFYVIRWLKRFPWSIHIRLCTLLLHITYHVNIYTCVTPCIFTCNYLWCLNACQWRCGIQTFFRTWVTRVSMLFNHLIDGYYHSLYICFTK